MENYNEFLENTIAIQREVLKQAKIQNRLLFYFAKIAAEGKTEEILNYLKYVESDIH